MRLIRQLLRFVLKVFLGLLAAMFAIGLLAAALLVLVLSLLKSLITGRQTAPAMVFKRFQRYSPQGMWPGHSTRDAQRNTTRKGYPDDQIVDVQAREIRDDDKLR